MRDSGDVRRCSAPKAIQAVYTNLNPKLSYVLALTYANDHVYHRVQSLEAGDGIVLHGPYALPNGKATRVIVKVPSEAMHDGKLTLTWKLHGEANVTVSIIELWADAPTSTACTSVPWSACRTAFKGSWLTWLFDGVSNAQVSLSVPARTTSWWRRPTVGESSALAAMRSRHWQPAAKRF